MVSLHFFMQIIEHSLSDYTNRDVRIHYTWASRSCFKCLGVLWAARMSPEQTNDVIGKIKKLTSNPFAISSTIEGRQSKHRSISTIFQW